MPDEIAPQQARNQTLQPTPGGQSLRDVAVELRGQGGVTLPATLQITSLTDRARFKRALKTSGMLFGLALASLPIPPIHWILVPGFLIAAVIAFFVRMQTNELLGGHVNCPKCQASFPLESQPPTWPLDLTCHHCKAQLTVVPLP